MVTPFINLSGRANEAIAFYEKIFNGQDKRIMHYKDAPLNPDFLISDEMKEYVLHAEMTICGTRVNFSDTQQGVIRGDIISLAVDLPAEDQVRDVFYQLKEDGEILMDLSPQFFSPMYGWVKDKFGISWQIIKR